MEENFDPTADFLAREQAAMQQLNGTEEADFAAFENASPTAATDIVQEETPLSPPQTNVIHIRTIN
jgi:hypothetical protein